MVSETSIFLLMKVGCRNLSKIIFKNPIHTSNKTHLHININWLIPFKETIPVYTENYVKLMDAKRSVADC
jgi:hypothetical protein